MISTRTYFVKKCLNKVLDIQEKGPGFKLRVNDSPSVLILTFVDHTLNVSLVYSF